MFIKHKVYGMIFNLFRIFPLKSNKISFLTDKKGLFESNFNYIAKELDYRNNLKLNDNSNNQDFKDSNNQDFKDSNNQDFKDSNNQDFKDSNNQDFKDSNNQEIYEYHYVSKDEISFKNMYNLATSKYVFFADNFFPTAFMNFHKDAILIQLWHASGIFKKFGYDFVDEDYQKLLSKIGNRMNYLLVSSKNVSEIFAHSFAMDVTKTLPFGNPKFDYYSKEHTSEENKNRIRLEFESKYPSIKNKKIVLYAPTFRETSKYNNVFNYFDFNRFIEELGDEYSLFIRLHPRMSQFSDTDFETILQNPNIINVGDFKDEEELLLVSDVLITDYSSMMAEYALLRRPIVFFAYDLDNYIKNERDFYIDYKEDVPGNVVYNMDQLISLFKENDFNLDRLDKFLNYQLEYIDDKSTKRLVDFLFGKE